MVNLIRYATATCVLSSLVFAGVTGAQADDKTGIIRIQHTIEPIPEPAPVPVSSSTTTYRHWGCPLVWHAAPAGQYGAHGPVMYPIHRNPVVYQRYWPKYWYGDPRAGMPAGAYRAPMVFLPTDTTQLGFYYQRVPQWQPNPGMLPPAPGPWIHHFRQCGHRHSGNQCPGYYGTVIEQSPTPAKPQAPVPPEPEKTARR